MAVASSMFYSSNDSEKQTLSSRIAPTQEQYDEQQERWNLLADHLIDALRKSSGHPISTWLQGSYKFGTQVRPSRSGEEFDIDLGVYYGWDGAPEDGSFSARALKDFVQRSLIEYCDANSDDVIEVTEPKERCCRIRFKGAFHIDVPCYHLDSDEDMRSLATQSDTWEESDPKAIYKWFRDLLTDTRRAKARRYIRYMKCWANLKLKNGEGRPSSILATVLVAEAVDRLGDEQIEADDEGFKSTIVAILNRLDANRTVHNPANKSEVLSARLSNKEYDAFVDGLRTLRDIAERAIDTPDLIAACETWSEAFEHFFPAPEEEELTEAVSQRSLSKALVPILFDPEISVVARAQNNHSGVWQGRNKIGPIPKDCWIDFTLANDYLLPSGATVHWVARNQGREAESNNDMGHRGGVGPTWRDHSAYNGTHYMDCTVRLGRQVIGFRRVPVQIFGTPMPPRNPLRRPVYTKLMGRR